MHRGLCALALVLLGHASQAAANEKFASIIIDDIGNNLERGQAVIDFPAALTLAILPRTVYSRKLALLARKKNKEVMLHLPLQSVENHTNSPGTLSLHMTKQQFAEELKLNIESVPYIRGINNHMGSLLTRHPGHMNWLMSEIAKYDTLYFVDSLTTSKSVASDLATEHNIPNLSRDVFLDPDFSDETLQLQFDQLIEIINKRGYALAIAHPHPRSLQFIQNHLVVLEQNNITVIPVSELIARQRSKQHVTCTGAACAGM